MNDGLNELRDKIKKNIKGVHSSILSESNIASDRFWVKTPALDLNRALSGSLKKGIQSRNLVGIVGPEHTMKSSFMVLCLAEAQKNGYKPIIIDTEGGITDDFCRRWGLDPKGILYNYTPWISEVISIMGQIKETQDEGYVIGLDSVGGLDRLKTYNDALAGAPKADQGLLQKEIRSMLKLFLNICVGQNSIGIACGHMYGSPGMIPMPDQVGGGKAMKLFPSVLISLKKKVIKEGDKIVGSDITATTLKNRLYPPFQQATIQLDYINGIKPYAGLMEIVDKMGGIEKAGSWYSYKGERLGQGTAKAESALGEVPGLLDDIEKWLSNTGYSTVNEQLKEAEELLKEAENKGLDLEDIIEEKPKIKKIKGVKKK